MKGQIQTHQNDFDRVKYDCKVNIVYLMHSIFLFLSNYYYIGSETNVSTTSDNTDIKRISSQSQPDPIYAFDYWVVITPVE